MCGRRSDCALTDYSLLFFVQVNWSGSQGKWVNEGQASWSEDKIDLSLDNDPSTDSPSTGGYIEIARSYFSFDYEKSLTDLYVGSCSAFIC